MVNFQARKIETMGDRLGVRVTVDAKRKLAQIRIQGQLRDAIEVETPIRNYLHSLELNEQKKKEAQLLCQFVSDKCTSQYEVYFSYCVTKLHWKLQVQWEFEDRPNVFTPYPEDINVKIEKAYQDKDLFVKWIEDTDSGDVKHIQIDFTAGVEIDSATKTKVKVKRRDLSKEGNFHLLFYQSLRWPGLMNYQG